MQNEAIYMDNAATTQVDPAVVEAMLPYFTERYAVASSQFSHSPGIEVREGLEAARATIAQALGAAKPEEVIFTSGETESNNWALRGMAQAFRGKKNHLVVSKIESRSVLDTAKALEKEGVRVTHLDVDGDGFVNLEQLRDSLTEDTFLVSIQHANEEMGTIQDIDAIAAIVKAKGVVFHTDASQTFTKVPLNLTETPADLATITAHLIHGPKGIAALYVREGTPIAKWMQGGFMEFNLRGGVENVPGAAGFAKAVELSSATQVEYTAALRDLLIDGIMARIPKTELNGPRHRRLPGNVNVSFHYAEGESTLLHLDMMGIAVVTGSACFSRSLEPSYVLMAMGKTHELAHGSIRYSLSRYNTVDEVDRVVEATAEVIETLRRISPLGKDEK
jgi:cysteine desulfurase